MINDKKISKILSLVLRHKPETLGIELDEQGWTSVEDLLQKMNASGRKINLETLNYIVETNAKKRFAFNKDKTRLRANQGHSIQVDLGLKAKIPPAILFHGTAERNLKSIFETGLTKQSRHHVHLSTNLKTASEVGRRYGKLVVLKVDASKMYNKKHLFYESDNGVWLTNMVPSEYLSIINVSLSDSTSNSSSSE